MARGGRRATTGAGRSWRLATIVALLLSAGLVVLALVSLSEQGTRVRRYELPAEVLRCWADADCMLVNRIGCCPCQSGGARWAINSQEWDRLRRFLKHACGRQAVCVQLDACGADLQPVCVESQCVARRPVAPRAATPAPTSSLRSWRASFRHG